MRDLPESDPQIAIDGYTQFLGNRPGLCPLVVIDVCSSIAKLYATGLDNKSQAHLVYDWALKKYAKDPRSVPLILQKAKLLESSGETEAALKFYSDHLDAIFGGWPHYANDPLDDYSRLLLKSGKPEETATVLGNLLVMQPVFLDGGPINWDWVYPRITDTLIATGNPRGAMAWAKLRFMEAAYDAEPMRRASALLIKVWRAADPGGTERKAFLTAENDPDVPNPLAGYSLPTLDHASVAARLDGATVLDRISLEIAVGKLREAMIDARSMIANGETAGQGIRQVCRVFKAADLNLNRANAYLEYLKTGQGPDPVAVFLSQPQAVP